MSNSNDRVWRIRVDAQYGPADVLLPESVVMQEVQRAVARALGPGVGFSFGRAFRSISRAVKSAVKSPGKLATAPFRIAAAPLGQVTPRILKDAAGAITRRAERVANQAYSVARPIVESDEFAAGLTAASFAVPALAPAAGAVLAANKLAKQINRGTKAAEQIARGVQSVALRRDLQAGHEARQAAIRAVAAARQGDPAAQHFMGAWRQFGRPKRSLFRPPWM